MGGPRVSWVAPRAAARRLWRTAQPERPWAARTGRLRRHGVSLKGAALWLPRPAWGFRLHTPTARQRARARRRRRGTGARRGTPPRRPSTSRRGGCVRQRAPPPTGHAHADGRRSAHGASPRGRQRRCPACAATLCPRSPAQRHTLLHAHSPPAPSRPPPRRRPLGRPRHTPRALLSPRMRPLLPSIRIGVSLHQKCSRSAANASGVSHAGGCVGRGAPASPTRRVGPSRPTGGAPGSAGGPSTPPAARAWWGDATG